LIQSQLTDLSVVPFDPELSVGAANAVNACLRIQPHEQVTIITDLASREIAASIVDQVKRTSASFRAFVLEEIARRPLERMPEEILEALEKSDVSVFAVQVQTNELKSRMEMTEVVNRRRIRHGHMVNINKQIMMQGMRADFGRVDAISKKVLSIVSDARRITATTAAGTDLTAQFNPAYRWLKTSGIISPEKWGNLPGGEVFTTPGEVDGTFVVDGVVGDYLCARYGDLRHAPLHLRIKQNRLTEAWSENKQLQDDFWRYTHTDENSDRVGEFAIGTNVELSEVIGHILQDEKFPGVHIAFGNPYGEHTGANWYSSTHIDVVGLHFNIWADEQQIMKNGRFLIEA
jgi:aminopeptidase